jgi:hypothetical protein
VRDAHELVVEGDDIRGKQFVPPVPVCGLENVAVDNDGKPGLGHAEMGGATTLHRGAGIGDEELKDRVMGSAHLLDLYFSHIKVLRARGPLSGGAGTPPYDGSIRGRARRRKGGWGRLGRAL